MVNTRASTNKLDKKVKETRSERRIKDKLEAEFQKAHPVIHDLVGMTLGEISELSNMIGSASRLGITMEDLADVCVYHNSKSFKVGNKSNGSGA